MKPVPGHIPLLGWSRKRWVDWLADQGCSPVHAASLVREIHRHGELSLERMDSIPRHVRAVLFGQTECVLPSIVESSCARDGTRKWLLRLACGDVIETVLIPAAGRATLCLSSQAGCALNCTFCRTARSGFGRNLTAHEIVSQLWLVRHRLQPDIPVTHVVFMGMGEPLANLDAVADAANLFRDSHAYSMGCRQVTVSTAGLVPGIDRLRQVADVSLAVSLHAPDDALRTQLMPINARYPIDDLLAACRRYVDGGSRKRKIIIEYVLLDDVNDSSECARALAKRLRNLPCKVNLIPFNAFPESGYAASPESVRTRFREILCEEGIVATTRRPRGDDIAAACGQLAGDIRRPHEGMPWVDRPVLMHEPLSTAPGAMA
ncbi:MAG: 23S rRNA (adenine(2503)-C(2))-methyltransferase RlmN [Gammaproteobacteria bacterium]|nr:23S rRNA (adenine(2503)-C(2))-methyltransferase RlmN [Gammaproteobacteria bacterium]